MTTPADSYVDETDFKSWARLEIDDNVDSAAIQAVLSSASRAVAHHCRRQFHQTITSAQDATARRFEATSPTVCLVDDFWTTTGFVVETSSDATTWDTWSSTDYELEPINGMVDGSTHPYYRVVGVDRSFPISTKRRALVRVTAKWGWAEVPAPVKHATRLLAARMLKRRESPLGLLEFAGDGSSVRVSAYDGDVTAALAPFVRADRWVVG